MRPHVRPVSFERLVVVDREGRAKGGLDAGRLAEDLLFYQQVRLVVGRGELKQLIAAVKPEPLLELMSRGALRVTYANNVISTHTKTRGVIRYYDPLLVTTEMMALEPTAYELFGDVEANGSRAIEFADRFLKYADDRPYPTDVCTATRDLLDDADAVDNIVRAILRATNLFNADLSGFRFRPARQDDGTFTVDTNLPFERLSDHEFWQQGPLTPARLIAFFSGIRAKLALAAEDRADFDTATLDAVVLAAHLSKLIRARNTTADEVFQFQRLTLGNGNAISDAVNSGAKRFDDLLVLLDRAAEFRTWLGGSDPDADLLNEYYEAVTRNTWAAKLPGKAFRWLVTTAVGAAAGAAIVGTPGLAVGAAIGALDAFVVDRLATGWRPNQFVDGPLRDFADPCAE